MKKRYIVLAVGTVLILCYFMFGSVYFANYELDRATEIDELHVEKESILQEMDSTLYLLKQSHQQTQHTIEELSSEEYIQQKTIIQHNILERDSIVINSQTVIVPIYVYDTVTVPVVIHDTVYKIVELDSLIDTKKRKSGIFKR